MNDRLNPNMMLEATRLTRAGRLAEATALLQRMLRGETVPDKSSGSAGEVILAEGGPPVIDVSHRCSMRRRLPGQGRRDKSRPKLPFDPVHRSRKKPTTENPFHRNRVLLI